MNLDTALGPVLGAKTAKVLDSKLGLRTVRDLLTYAPRDYLKRGELTDLATLEVDRDVTVVARVESVRSRSVSGGRRSMLTVVVGDGVHRVELVFFNQKWREKQLQVGALGLFSGTVGRYRNTFQLTHPDFQMLPDAHTLAETGVNADDYASELIPVYKATASLPSWKIAQAVRLVLASVDIDAASDPLPAALRMAEGLPKFGPACRHLHQPETWDEVGPARDRFKWEEALALSVVLARRRRDRRSASAVSRSGAAEGILTAFDSTLPFALTDSQQAVGEQLLHDVAAEVPMNRLLQGEVGSGKTLVALRLMLAVVDAGGQCAMIAPTEVLALQHYRSICGLLGELLDQGVLSSSTRVGPTVKVEVLTGSLSAAARRERLLGIASGETSIVVGTHALLEETVQFSDLGLVVIDEQHRFGVEQRSVLTERESRATRPHVLVMTATPIPRTVAMTVFGDLEVSELTQMPPGRSDVVTHIVSPARQPRHAERVWERVVEEVTQGHKVFVVCPRIQPGESLPDTADTADGSDLDEVGLASVVDLYEELTAGPLADVRVRVLHGQLPADEKDATMRAFASPAASPSAVDVLVTTTVIEVGVDVPEATMMVVMNAERFGISQLHQLRGRIGRGHLDGLCLLMSDADADSEAGQRLADVASTTDGFELSERDFRRRGAGDVLGASQWGRRASLRHVSLTEDGAIIRRARPYGEQVVESDPDLRSHPSLRQLIEAILGDEGADWLERF